MLVEMKSHPHPERPDRLRAIASSLAAAGDLCDLILWIFPGRCSLIPAREVTQEELLRVSHCFFDDNYDFAFVAIYLLVHSLDHVEAVQHTSHMLARCLLFPLFTFVLYISLHRHENGRFYPGTGAVDEVLSLLEVKFVVSFTYGDAYSFRR
ncbi:hypothetical protein B296_00033823 [Ensete ventricosum]|uniref:histone deacetylase n=1 Tax=Ensete ventricosum TaxID=4639 RepID=A0A426YBA8_ENSVE|nr:hypothetical protein B296_00033823 [Ensete ventricosum]